MDGWMDGWMDGTPPRCLSPLPSVSCGLNDPEKELWSIYHIGIIVGYGLWSRCVHTSNKTNK